VAGNRGSGIDVGAADAIIESTVVHDTQSQPDGQFGDGIAVVSAWTIQATATITAARISSSARAGIASFGGLVTVGSTAFECNAIDLDGEYHQPFDYGFDDLGGNVCRCGAQTSSCAVQSANLMPPQPLP
jgi:hypothetical protein